MMMRMVSVGVFVGLLAGLIASAVMPASGRDHRETCECRELRTIRQILMGYGPPSIPPVPTPTGTPDGGPLE
jgi:hypothetical protein